MLKPAPLFALLLTAAVAVGAPVNYGAAIERQRARVTAEPTNAGARNDLGNLLVLVGDFAGAEAAYREAIAIEPKRAATHFNLGLLLQERGDHATAMLQFRKTIDLAPDHAWAREFGRQAHHPPADLLDGVHLERRLLAVRLRIVAPVDPDRQQQALEWLHDVVAATNAAVFDG